MNSGGKPITQRIISILKETGSIFGAIVTPLIIVLSLNTFIRLSKNTFETTLALTISFEFILLLFLLVIREVISTRKEKYANITEKHHFCFHTTRNIETFLNEIDSASLTDDDKKRIFTTTVNEYIKILDNMATIFSMLTGTRCRAAIKTIYERNSKLFVRTLARDNVSYEYNYNYDKERYDDDKDAIEENEDFELLYDEQQPGQSYFFCNNLIRRLRYKSSSFKLYGAPSEEIGWLDCLYCKGWTLPYRSTIVWPIQQRKDIHFTFNEIGCIGFLAVDSESREVFNKNWDTWIGAGIADALFHPINSMFKVLDESDLENEK